MCADFSCSFCSANVFGIKGILDMNVYDFDGTIYRGDSTVDFYFFCLFRYPLMIFSVPVQFWGMVSYKAGRIDKTQMKSYFFSFLKKVKKKDEIIQKFWKKNIKKIYAGYRNQQEEDDVIISASPEFLLQPVCNQLGIKNLVASEVDLSTGKFLGKNCYGEEKIRRFQEAYGAKAEIQNFYSDSISDLPMAQMAAKAFFCRKGERKRWEI